MKKIILSIVLSCVATCSWADWPSLPYPNHAKVEAIGEQVRLNGVPMRMHRILSEQSAESMLVFYKKALGTRHAQAEFYGTHILSQERGDYFITVRISKLSPSLTETLLSISDGRASQRIDSMPLGFSLPADSELLSDMESTDAGKSSRQLIFNNGHSMQTNANFITKVLQDKGYALQPKLTVKHTNSLSLMFEGNKREARLVVTQGEGETSAVLTTILSQ
ncbi:hypothetical protein Meth11DRAFT_0119 [Methylophilaceae bacterium 11]|nr:hypothetical protein Meth11DRAFT_0119 [Methylophilaceae bacterium 11]